MTIKELKKELGLSQKDIAKFFDMEYFTFSNSTAKERYETALCRFYEFLKGEGKKEKDD
jgi:transcriptional regulator with XRE-family HTH domain